MFGKGGAGKSTVTAFLAAAFREAGCSVLVLAADSTNHGAAQALGMDREPDFKEARIRGARELERVATSWSSLVFA